MTMTANETSTIRLTPAEFAATAEKFGKINERAAKKGFTGRLGITGEMVTQTTTDQSTGLNKTEVFYDAQITGEAPSYGGWTFLARIDTIPAGVAGEEAFTIATAPGVEHVDRSLVRAGECDHCGHNRARKQTMLVRNDETGEVVNVGSTCIKDFLGWDANVVFIFEDTAEREIEDIRSKGFEPTYTVDTILAYAYAATRAFGWVPASAYDGRPTADWVRLGLGFYRPNDKERAALETLRAYAAEANEKVATIKAWILSDDFSGQSTYVDNLKVAANLPSVTSKQIGLLASAPNAYARHLETEADRKAREARWAAEKSAKTASDYIAEVGAKKVLVEGKIDAIRYISGTYGTTTLYTILTNEGNVVKWFASSEALGDQEGREVKITGTVKKHEEYQGIKATVLTRCKEVTE